MAREDSRNYTDRRLTNVDDKRRVLDLGEMNIVPPGVGIFDSPTRCYVVNEQWASIIMGMVSWLAHPAVWRDANDLDYPAIAEINQFLVGGNCMTFQLRQSPTDPCLLEQSFDGGDSWSTAFDYALCLSQTTSPDAYEQSGEALQNIIDNYDGTTASVAPHFVYTGDSENDEEVDKILCETVRFFIYTACNLEQARRDQGILNVLIAALIIIIVGIATLLSGGVASGIYILIGGALTAGGATLFNSISESVLKNREVQDNVACCMYNALKGVTIDQATFEGSLGGCEFEPLSQESQLAGAIAQIIGTDRLYESFLGDYEFFYQRKDWWYFNCPCTDEWEQIFDFTVESYDTEWTPTEPTYTPIWIDGVGLEGGRDSLGCRNGLYFSLPFATNIVFAEAEMSYYITAANTRLSGLITSPDAIFDQVTSDRICNQVSYVAGVGSYNYECHDSEGVESIAILFGSRTGSSSYTRISRLTIRGTGTNPFS